MNILFAPTTWLVFLAFWLFCAFNAVFWLWTSGAIGEDFKPPKNWFAGFGYYTSSALAGACFYCCVVAPLLPTPAYSPAAHKSSAAAAAAPAALVHVMYPPNYKGPEMYGVPLPK